MTFSLIQFKEVSFFEILEYITHLPFLEKGVTKESSESSYEVFMTFNKIYRCPRKLYIIPFVVQNLFLLINEGIAF